jgi:hypothetical protein
VSWRLGLAGALAALTSVASACDGAEVDDAAPKGAAQASCEPKALFTRELWDPVIKGKCGSCHAPGGLAGATRLVVAVADVDASYVRAEALARDGRLLVAKATGQGHGGGAVVEASSAEGLALARFADEVEGRCAPAAGPVPARLNGRFLRRLSVAEYENTVRDLLGVDGYAARLPVDGGRGPFENEVVALRTDAEFFRAVLDNARELSLLPALPPELDGCVAAGPCVKRFVEQFGLRVFRRPLSVEEVGRYEALYGAVGAGDHKKGARGVVRGMLASPFFLFRAELGVDVGGGKSKLTPWEVASELSYLFWATTPDAALLSAARAGKLSTPDDVLAQAERMLDDPRARRSLDRFVNQWLGLNVLADKAKSPERFAGYDAEVRADFAKEPLELFASMSRTPSDTLTTLLTSDTTSVGPAASRYYGLPPTVGTGARAPGRSGILTSGALLAIGATGEEPVAILRGKLVRTRLLCQEIGEPPANAADVAAALPAPKDNRERAVQLMSNPACAACHRKMDPLGLVYESFDATGRLVTGRDTTGEILDTGALDGAVTGPADLHAKLAASVAVRECFTRLWTRYALGVGESTELAALVTRVVSAAASPTGLGLRRVLLAAVTSEHFLVRASDGAATGTPGTPAIEAAPVDGGGGAAPVTSGITFEPQAGYENGGREEGAGNWWMRGTIQNGGAQVASGWSAHLARAGTFVASDKVAVDAVGAQWVLRSGSTENAALEPGRRYYVDFRFSK